MSHRLPFGLPRSAVAVCLLLVGCSGTTTSSSGQSQNGVDASAAPSDGGAENGGAGNGGSVIVHTPSLCAPGAGGSDWGTASAGGSPPEPARPPVPTDSHCPTCDTPLGGDTLGNRFLCGDVNHRAEDRACPPIEYVPRDVALPATGLRDECLRDVDCTSGAFGLCGNRRGIGGAAGNTCSYGCATAQDCASNELCECGSTTVSGHCVDASCKSDADCGPGKMCVLARGPSCSGSTFYTCQTEEDECASFQDCPAGIGSRCVWNGQRFACDATSCPIE